MKWENAKKQADDATWAFLELRPTGKINSKEQYDYVCYYCAHTAIDGRYIKPFEEVKGKYIHLGNWFGGASFYYYFSEQPEGCDEMILNKDGACIGYKNYFKDFSYGKLGRIEFE